MSKSPINPKRLQAFGDAYLPNLLRAVTERPTEYDYGAAGVPKVHAKMVKAFAEGTFNHQGHALRWTCRDLGIPHTRKAIIAYLTEGWATP